MPPLETTAGGAFDLSLDNSLGDAEQRRLRYHLLRLTVVGLGETDVAELGELGRLAFQGAAVRDQTDKIKGRDGVSPVAAAIADIVGTIGIGQSGGAQVRDVFLGAVLGAYAGLHGLSSSDKENAAVLGAIGGAVATPTSAVIAARMADIPLEQYLRMDE